MLGLCNTLADISDAIDAEAINVTYYNSLNEKNDVAARHKSRGFLKTVSDR